MSGYRIQRQFPDAFAEPPAPVPDLVRSLRRLAARVEWLEGRLRASGLVPVADLDGADAELVGLAEAVVAGRDAEEGLLGPEARNALSAVVEAYSRLERDQDRAARELLTVSTALESTARTDPAHADDLSRFDEAERRYNTIAADLARGASSAQAARRRLDEDDELGAQCAPALTAGQEAESELDGRLRTRLAAELDRSALMPSWFSADLGPAPTGPIGVWLDIAVAALVYRLVYDVDDTCTVLGVAPDPDAPRHRAEDYARLAAELAELGRA